jgi:hypothetical protein
MTETAMRPHHSPDASYEKTLVDRIKSNLLLKNQMYNISSLQLNTIKNGLIKC